MIGGSADWLGNAASHEAQELRMSAMSVAMFGQNMLLSALSLMEVVP